MQAPLEICYAGVVIARTEEVREGEGGEFFIVTKDPLPVGTLLGLRSADSLVSVRVLRVVEATDGAGSGMQVRPARSDEAGAVLWIPPPPPPPPAAKPASTPPAALVQAPAAVAPPASDEPAPAQDAPAAVVMSASESPAAVSSEDPGSARKSAREVVEPPAVAESVPAPVASEAQAADAAPAKQEEPPRVAEAAPAESATVPEAVPAVVGSSLTGALQGAAASGPEAASGAVAASEESAGSGDVVAPIEGDLPPARPVQGAGGRRRTKRRR